MVNIENYARIIISHPWDTLLHIPTMYKRKQKVFCNCIHTIDLHLPGKENPLNGIFSGGILVHINIYRVYFGRI